MIRFNDYFSAIPVLGKKSSYNTVDSWFRIKKNAALGWNKLLIVCFGHIQKQMNKAEVYIESC